MLLARVRAALRRHRMIAADARVVAACSGGQDSVALVHLLHRLRDEFRFELAIATLDHGLRGDDGRADVAFVRAFGESLGVPVYADAIDARALAQRDRVSAPVAARTARLRFLRRTASDLGATRIALGHTTDDQAETVLMHLLRGAGLDGLAGMAPVRPPFIRPLLGCWRRETAMYCGAHGLAFRTDPGNRDQRHLRVRLREHLLPLLEAEYQPRLREHLVALAADSADDAELLERQARESLRLTHRGEDGRVGLPANLLRGLSPALRRRLVRAILADLRGTRADLTREHLHAVDALLEPGARRVEVPGVAIARDGDTIWFAPSTTVAKLPGMNGPVTLAIPGETRVAALECVIAARLLPAPPEALTNEPTRAWLDAGAAGTALQVRTRRPGDRFRPLGAPGSVSLQDFFINAKVPRSRRDRTPLVVAGDRIAWVVGHRIADDFRITPATGATLELTAHPLALAEPPQRGNPARESNLLHGG